MNVRPLFIAHAQAPELIEPRERPLDDDRDINNGSNSSNGSAGSFGALSGQGLILQGWRSNFTRVFTVDANGNLDVSGNLNGGRQQVSESEATRRARSRALRGREPGELVRRFWHGAAARGATEVSLDPGFLQTVDTAADYHVFLTPNGDCRGLYIARKTPTGFEVRELGHGNASIAFDYRIVARRRGFENIRIENVHLPQGPKNMQASLANIRSAAHTVAPSAPRITVPALPHPFQQGR